MAKVTPKSPGGSGIPA